MYLGEEVVRFQLAECRWQTARIGLLSTAKRRTSRDRRQRHLQRLAHTGSGEALRLTVDRLQAVALIEASVPSTRTRQWWPVLATENPWRRCLLGIAAGTIPRARTRPGATGSAGIRRSTGLVPCDGTEPT